MRSSLFEQRYPGLAVEATLTSTQVVALKARFSNDLLLQEEVVVFRAAEFASDMVSMSAPGFERSALSREALKAIIENARETTATLDEAMTMVGAGWPENGVPAHEIADTLMDFDASQGAPR